MSTSSLAAFAPRHPGLALALERLTPNWFTVVMGTAIVANAARVLPDDGRAVRVPATGFWLLATLLLAVLLGAWALQLLRDPGGHPLRRAVDVPAIAQFFGAPPLALLSVGAGFALHGAPIVGEHAAVVADAVLWTAGTVTGLAAAVAVPYLTFTRYELTQADTSATWLLPVVPPMLSASTGALLLPHVADPGWRLELLVADYLLLGASIVASAVVLVLLWGRLAVAGTGPSQMVPSLWIALGPIGTSVTAAVALGQAAEVALPRAAGALQAAAVAYGLVAWGFGALWLAVAALVTVRSARKGLPFALTWWAFTFPVGVFATAAAGLGDVTGSRLLAAAGVALYGLLLAGWLAAAPRTLRGALTGTLFPPLPDPARAET